MDAKIHQKYPKGAERDPKGHKKIKNRWKKNVPKIDVPKRDHFCARLEIYRFFWMAQRLAKPPKQELA